MKDFEREEANIDELEQIGEFINFKEEDYRCNELINNEFEEFINTIKERSKKDFNVKVTKDDNILTLSTCANNNKYRVVLHAKKTY